MRVAIRRHTIAVACFVVGALALLGLGFTGSARAADDCGPPVGGIVVCNAANEASSYHDADGITYTVSDLTIQHPGDGTPSEFVASGGNAAFGNLQIFSSGVVAQTAVSNGTAGAGLFARSTDGTVSITTTASGSISTVGNGVFGIFAESDGAGANGVVKVNAEGAITTQGDGAIGLYANSDGAGGAVMVTSSAVTTHGGGAIGILAHSNGAGLNGVISIIANGHVSTDGDGAVGVYGQSDLGPIVIATQAVRTLGVGAVGIFASSGGAGVNGNLAVIATGAISTVGVGSLAVFASGGGTINVSTQAITTIGDGSLGIFTSSTGVGALGNIQVEAKGGISTQGVGAIGVYATTAGGITIETQAVETLAFGALGITAISTGAGVLGDVQVTAKGAVSTQGDGAGGILAQAAGGGVKVVAQDVSTDGDNAIAIFAAVTSPAPGSALTIGAADISTLGNGSMGVFATGSGHVSVTLDSVATAGLGAYGVNATATGDTGLLNVWVKGAVSTQDGGAIGISANNMGTDLTSATTVIVDGPVNTKGATAFGILAIGNGNTVKVESNAITTLGSGAQGIIAQNLGATPNSGVMVLAKGAIQTSGQNAHGIFATANGGAVSVEAQGAVLASGEHAIGVEASGNLMGAIVSVGDVQGGWTDGIGVVFGSATAGMASTLTVRAGGSVGALTDMAIFGSAGDDTVLLHGEAVGGLNFVNGDDTLHVFAGGRYVLRNFADSDGDGQRDTVGVASAAFGIGTDLLRIDSGGVLALGAAGPTDIGTLTGLETLENAGLITLADLETGGGSPGAGDRLYTQFNYDSFGGRLHLDARLDAGGPGAQLTDRFLVDGDASGVTLVTIQNDPGQGASTGTGNTAGISIVQVAGNAAADSFLLGAPTIAGAWQYDIVAFDPASSDAGEKDPMLAAGDFWDYRLQSSFFNGVYEYAALMQGANLLAQAALEAAMNRPAEPPVIAAPPQTAALGAGDLQEAIRPTAGDGVATGAWLAGFGEGLQVSPGEGVEFTQDNYGIQAGYDLFGWRGLFGGEDRLVLGVMGTIAQGKLDFSGSASTADLSLYGGGAYAAYADGGLRANLVAQLLTGSTDFKAPLPGVDSELDLTTLGLGAGLAWRFDFAQLFLQPGGELRYVHAWSEDFQDGGGADIGLDDSDSLVARGSVKAGMSFANVAPYLSLGVAHEFLGETGATASGLAFETSTQGTTFEVGGGVTAWALASNLTLTLDARYRFGDEVEGLSVTGGVKLSW